MDKPIVCMLHTGINRFVTETMAGVKEEEVEELLKQVQYLALGHIHSRYENPEKKYFNPGSLECVRITDNPFGKGFYLVNLNKKTYEIETQYKVVKNRNSINKSIDITLLEDDENLLEYIIKIITDEYKSKCKNNEKIMLQLKLTGVAKIGKFNINIRKIKNEIIENIPVLYCEIINVIDYKNEDEIILTENFTRKEIDKMVIEDKIRKQGFNESEINKVYNIVEKLKEYCQNEMIEIDSNYGKDIEEMLLDLDISCR